MQRGLILLVLFVLLLCSCGPSPLEPTATRPPDTATPPPDTATPLPDIEVDEAAVHSALLRQNPVNYDQGATIAIRQRTVSGGDMVESTLEEDERVPPSLKDSYRSRNAEAGALGPDLDFDLDYILMPEEDWDEIFGKSGAVWTRFQTKYPEASGLVTFSSVGFNANQDQALAIMYYRCGDLCSMGGLFLLVKEDGNWVVQEELMSWMS